MTHQASGHEAEQCPCNFEAVCYAAGISFPRRDLSVQAILRQAEQIALFRKAWADAGHNREPRVSGGDDWPLPLSTGGCDPTPQDRGLIPIVQLIQYDDPNEEA